jgi:tripartite-type tricarboxylate transporter receptor subunit TctC
MRVSRFLFGLLLGALVAHPALAQDGYPNRVIKLVVPWSPGGFNDVLGRLVAERMSKTMGQQVLVDNRPGATGTIGTEAVARSPGDGYTLLMATADTHAIAPSVFSQLRYDPVKDFTPVSLLVAQPVVIWAGETMPAKTLADLVKMAKDKPGNLTYASIGMGSTTHLGMERFNLASGIELNHVPYKGSGPAMSDVLSGRVDAILLTFGGAGGHATSGKLRPLAITSSQRYSFAPTIPTVAESGYPGFELTLWNGVMVPSSTPAAIVQRLEKELKDAVQSPEVKEKLAGLGVEPIGTSSSAFKDFQAREIVQWGQAAKAAKVQLD